MNKIQRIYHLLKTLLIYQQIFKSCGLRSIIISPLKLEGTKRITLGNRVMVGYKSWLATAVLSGDQQCVLTIKDGCSIGNFNHIYATKSVVIEKNVLTADKVYISDNLHGYIDINLPIIKQPIVQSATVVIGEGSWIGENACVLGVKIGKNCVVGANAVVTKDIPDYCVAVGIPAKIIKRYDLDTLEWKKTDSLGNFIS